LVRRFVCPSPQAINAAFSHLGTRLIVVVPDFTAQEVSSVQIFCLILLRHGSSLPHPGASDSRGTHHLLATVLCSNGSAISVATAQLP
jgi:hypothetical protein